MMVINNLSFNIGANKVLDNISFVLNGKIGLVGKNGSGKSTLLKIISNNIKEYKGNVDLNNESVGYLCQEIPHIYDNMSIVEYIKYETGFDVLESKIHQLETNLNEKNMEEYGDLLNYFLSIDGYNFNENLNSIMIGLNLNSPMNTPIGILSGGQKMKVLLANLILSNKDILLLDEPTNNLDLSAIEWLENYLKVSNKKMLVVSHDEQFLNNIVGKIFELDNGTIKEYNMSYHDYLITKEQEYKQQYEDYIKKINEKNRLKRSLQKAKEWSNIGNSKKSHNDNDKIANNYAKERTNNSNISKINKQLDDLKIPSFEEKEKINFFLNIDESKGNKDIILKDLVCGYDNFSTPILNLNIVYGSKIQITGKNGSGKTTLINTILGKIEPLNGNVIVGSAVKLGIISQDTININSKCTVIEYLTNKKDNIDLSLIFILLDKFGINYTDKDKIYNTLSPGERTKVNLVKIALDKINVLILDEVTNHLDKEAIDLIFELISLYNGTIISISHNRKYNEILNSDVCLDMNDGLVKYKKYDDKFGR